MYQNARFGAALVTTGTARHDVPNKADIARRISGRLLPSVTRTGSREPAWIRHGEHLGASVSTAEALNGEVSQQPAFAASAHGK